jgi:microsomal dipeptidase-like Zn-dependent dipeptidase
MSVKTASAWGLISTAPKSQPELEMLPDCKIWWRLCARGFGEPLIAKVRFGNWLRVLGQTWGETG